jgi:hypothetical protein
MTKVDRINRWLTLGANFGVVLGLILIIFDLRQNAAINLTAMEMQANAELNQIEFIISQPDIARIWMTSVNSPEVLTDAELRVMDGLLVALLLQMDQRFQMAKSGVGTYERAREHVANTVPFYFGSRFGKQWWTKQTAGWDGAELIKVGTPIINDLDENYYADYIDSIRVNSLQSAESTKTVELD